MGFKRCKIDTQYYNQHLTQCDLHIDSTAFHDNERAKKAKESEGDMKNRPP